MGFNTAVIMKPKKFKGTEKSKSSMLQGVDELIGEKDKDNETNDASPKEKWFNSSSEIGKSPRVESDFNSKPFKGIGSIKTDPKMFKGTDSIKTDPKMFGGIGNLKTDPKMFGEIGSLSEADSSLLDLKLQSAKKKDPKKEEVNSSDEKGNKFKTEKDGKGMWKESGMTAQERYYEKLKSRKGK